LRESAGGVEEEVIGLARREVEVTTMIAMMTMTTTMMMM
jgi:hypothetical protein